MTTVERLEQICRANLDAAVVAGWTPARAVHYVDSRRKQCCVVGANALERAPTLLNAGGFDLHLANAAGCRCFEIGALIAGWDGHPFCPAIDEFLSVLAFYELGKRLAVEYVK